MHNSGLNYSHLIDSQSQSSTGFCSGTNSFYIIHASLDSIIRKQCIRFHCLLMMSSNV